MKTLFKLARPYNILWIVGTMVFIAVLVLLYPNKNQIIQSELVVILVVITLFYAVQTKKIVEQEKKTFEQERERQIAIFEEDKLEKFYAPFSLGLLRLNNKIEALNWQNFRTEKEKVDEFFTEEIAELTHKYAYLALKETVGLIATINLFYKNMDELKINEEEKFYCVKGEFLKTIKSISKNINKKMIECMNKINEAYYIYEPSNFDTPYEILSITREAMKK